MAVFYYSLTSRRSIPSIALATVLSYSLAACDSAELSTTDINSETEVANPEQTPPEETTPVEETPAEEAPPEETTVETTPEISVPGAPVDRLQPVGDCTVEDNVSGGEGSELELTLTELQGHLDGSATLTNQQLDQVTASLADNAAQMTSNPALIEQAFATIALYDEVFGPLFLNDSTETSIPRTASAPNDAIHYAMIALQQSVIDHAYDERNVLRYRSTLEDRAFATADFFPGPVNQTDVSSTPYSVTIDASNNPSLTHRPYGAFNVDSRRPTGAYAAPGSIVEVTVPESLVGTGYKVRVGAHTWDLANKNTITRLDRVSLTYDILCSNTLVSNPLGGGIYIEVPFEADADAVNIEINNAVRSPFFAARNITDHTTLSDWEQEVNHPAPWADLESDHFMIQAPSAWLSEVDDPARLMEEWDTAMQSILNLYGITETHKTMLYVQIDRIFRGSANFPGYPMSNFPFNPASPNPNNSARAFLRGPDEVGDVTFHELGHQLTFTKFRGEIESVVHLPYVNFMNRVFNMDLDTAFSQSSFRNPNVNLDQSFMNWAVRPNFQQGLPMRTARPNSEKLYQRRGYAHYIVIAKLFGWQALERFWESEHVDFTTGIDYDRNSDGEGDVDSRILRLSRAAGVDLRPLIHVWGNHPEDADTLNTDILNEELPASASIYDELQHYKTLIPMDNEAFEDHARTFYPMLRENVNTEAFEGWYHETAQTWSASDGAASLQALQDIIDLYYPDGRPTDSSALTTDAPDIIAPAIDPAIEIPLLPVTVTEDTVDTDHHVEQ